MIEEKEFNILWHVDGRKILAHTEQNRNSDRTQQHQFGKEAPLQNSVVAHAGPIAAQHLSVFCTCYVSVCQVISVALEFVYLQGSLGIIGKWCVRSEVISIYHCVMLWYVRFGFTICSPK